MLLPPLFARRPLDRLRRRQGGRPAGLRSALPARVDEIDLDQTTLAIDSIIFGLRMNEGVDLDIISQRFPAWELKPELNHALDQLVEESYALRQGNHVGLTADGRLVADAIARDLLEKSGA